MASIVGTGGIHLALFFSSSATLFRFGRTTCLLLFSECVLFVVSRIGLLNYMHPYRIRCMGSRFIEVVALLCAERRRLLFFMSRRVGCLGVG